jgi:hypothetical protein
MTIEEAGVLLDELAEELPGEFYRELNGGVLLDPAEKRHPDAPGLYIMGEYHHHYVFGRYIVIYYGSFAQMYGNLPAGYWKSQLRKTLRHEFTHHVESLAGERGLERRDEEDLDRYWAGRRPK